MNVTRKLRVKFIAVFMITMLLFALALSAVIYFEKKAEMEYDCMVYLLNIHNYGNRSGASAAELNNYPPYFVIDIEKDTNTPSVVLGAFFLEEQGVTADELIEHLVGTSGETGILEEYHVRYFNGIRQENSHRISFIDVSYIDNSLRHLSGKIVLFALPSLAVLFVVAFLLSGWFAKPARNAIQEQNRFISKVSHELKTPLSIISANMDLLEDDVHTTDADFNFVSDNIRHECGRMNDLIQAMVWTALPGQETGNDEPVDLTNLLHREMLRFEVLAFDSGLSLSLETEPNLTVRGGETQITRLVDIIVDNALKYCTPGGSIRVTAGRKQGLSRRGIWLCVANTGEEIPKALCENIFKPFYQVDGTRKGAGLGLSIASEIVTAVRGSIHVEYRDGQNCFLIEF